MRITFCIWSAAVVAALLVNVLSTCAQPARVVTRLTDNEFDHVTPLVSGDNLVWRGFDGNDWEIYQRLGPLTRALTVNSLDDGDYGSGLFFQSNGGVRQSHRLVW